MKFTLPLVKYINGRVDQSIARARDPGNARNLFRNKHLESSPSALTGTVQEFAGIYESLPGLSGQSPAHRLAIRIDT